jgi:4-amino-4-deoxy-L-arabinose transferase-like glycosyltransferase
MPPHPPKIVEGFFRRHFQIIAFLAVIAGGAVLYTRALTTNPAGFYVDESSIAYNAQLIAQTGHDEHGVAWPLYFRAFGDYKNPVYIYLLAGIFKLTGPSILVARLLSAFVGFAGALLIGLLAWRVTKRRPVALVLTMTALLTPWLFELSRVVVEVALYPVLIGLLLLLVHRVSEKERWAWLDALSLAFVFALVTYTYSIGRLLGPLLALGLLLFLNRRRLWSIAKVWVLYGLSLLPLLIFQRTHPGALSARYHLITFITPQTGYSEDVLAFIKHYLANINPWKMTVSGDPNSFQIASVYGVGPVLLAVLILMLASIGLLLSKRRFSPWWRYLLYGLAVSFVPASLTRDYFHTLRLATVPVFMLALAIPAFEWIIAEDKRFTRAILFASIALVLMQGVFFQLKYDASAGVPRRLNLFDSDYASTILPSAIAKSGDKTIFIADTPPIPGYIQAFWYATLQRIPLEKFTVLPVDTAAPDTSVVITTEDTCPRCDVLFKRWPYTVYIAKGSTRSLTPLPADALRAEIRAIDYLPRLRMGEAATIRVAVRNAGPIPWLARERAVAPFQINVGNHWLDSAGRPIINDDGRATLLHDLLPGQEAEFSFTVNAPKAAGQYILEVDVLQENVSWFGLKGSKTLRLAVTVE